MANPVWKKNRNVYAEVLLEMVYNENLESPFNSAPPDGPLPTLKKVNIGPLHRKTTQQWNSRNNQVRPNSMPKRNKVSKAENELKLELAKRDKIIKDQETKIKKLQEENERLSFMIEGRSKVYNSPINIESYLNRFQQETKKITKETEDLFTKFSSKVPSEYASPRDNLENLLEINNQKPEGDLSPYFLSSEDSFTYSKRTDLDF
mmetsp:Transcript_9654/g.14381  ORF Transcript_9654/g.14381 Transcript_9654/m.14381 type:complete len:205 (-) Transcript_9654:929-1543(-)